ncbi:DUF736 domain-containing protein [Sphingomonas glacialis]|uniref:DUF736 domain-containing protein n=1 Tax=Sphingomonas glacialis TaxID=658225 RepID=A0A502FTZ3_9SPHN|nr:DUF736 domain-containing protein [Sphingomonas glacialis]TPG52586.1 DUF736 domain-containing protein [Sphingomonas glacialis]
MQIGRFARIGDTYVGQLETLALTVPLRIVPVADPGGERAPDWRVHLDDGNAAAEIGAGWTHEREGGGSFITVQLDCPTFTRPLRASLLQSRTQDEVHVLVWARQKRRQRED